MDKIFEKIFFKNYYYVNTKKVESYLLKKIEINVSKFPQYFKIEERIEEPYLNEEEVNHFINKYALDFKKNRPLYFLMKNDSDIFLRKYEKNTQEDLFDKVDLKKGYLIIASKT